MVSSTSVTDSLSLPGTGLDVGLSSVLQDLATVNSALDSDLGAWISSGDLGGYLGTDTLDLAIPATCLVVQAGETPDAWVSIPKEETSSKAIANLESLSWILLDDLVSGLTTDALIPIQSILVYQPDGSSDAAVYVSLEDCDSTLNTLPLDHTLDSFLYTDIVGVSSDLGLGDGFDTITPPAENPSSDHSLDVSTKLESETDLLASYDDLEISGNIAADGASDLLTPTSSHLNSVTDLADNLLNSSVDVDVASHLGSSSPSDSPVSECL